MSSIGDGAWPDMTVRERRALLDWLVETCVMFGCTLGTAFKVAGTFAEGLDHVCGVVSTEKLGSRPPVADLSSEEVQHGSARTGGKAPRGAGS